MANAAKESPLTTFTECPICQTPLGPDGCPNAPHKWQPEILEGAAMGEVDHGIPGVVIDIDSGIPDTDDTETPDDLV